MRSEIRNQPLIIVMAVLLAAIVVLVQVRLAFAADQVKPIDLSSPINIEVSGGEEPITVTGNHGFISTRDGEVVFDGTATKYPALYAIVGNVKDGAHQNDYTLGYLYQEQMKPETLTVWGGIHTFDSDSGVEMRTTLLPGPAQQTLYEAFGGYHGALFAYNYVTGEVYTMLSVPSAQDGPEDDGHLTNRVRSVYTPGSTMKIVTLVCALTQDPDFQNYTYTCTGAHILSSGAEVTCGVAHSGPLTMSQAIGKSCNCYFASLIEQLDVDETCDILEEMGISPADKYGTGYIDKISYKKGIASFENNTSFSQIWKLIGQGSEVSLIDMARMAGAVMNGGSCAAPYIVQCIYNPNEDVFTEVAEAAEMDELVTPETAALLKPMWADAVANYYSSRVDSSITLAKTGTSEHIDDTTGEEYNNRLLLGVMEEYNTAFMLVVERLSPGDSKIMDIANTLAQVLREADLS